MTAGALPRLPDENRGPRPFRASASSVVDRRLGVEALSLRAGGDVDSGFRRNDGGLPRNDGSEWPYPGMTGGWPYPVSPNENRGPRPFRASASSAVDRRLGVEALSLRAGGRVDSGFRRNDGGGGWPYPGMTGGLPRNDGGATPE